ncbi:MAG: hypothetical protein P8Z74_21275, partial [Acidobacteriota bacterium]
HGRWAPTLGTDAGRGRRNLHRPIQCANASEPTPVSMVDSWSFHAEMDTEPGRVPPGTPDIVGLDGPRVFPQYHQFLGASGYSADFEVQCSVVKGRLEKVRVLRVSVSTPEGSIPASLDGPKTPGRAFFDSIDSALKEWRFRETVNGKFQLRIVFKAVLLSPDEKNEYVIYRCFPASGVPRRIEIEMHTLIHVSQ